MFHHIAQRRALLYVCAFPDAQPCDLRAKPPKLTEIKIHASQALLAVLSPSHVPSLSLALARQCCVREGCVCQREMPLAHWSGSLALLLSLATSLVRPTNSTGRQHLPSLLALPSPSPSPARSPSLASTSSSGLRRDFLRRAFKASLTLQHLRRLSSPRHQRAEFAL